MEFLLSCIGEVFGGLFGGEEGEEEESAKACPIPYRPLKRKGQRTITA